jgi:hypothetical protein
MSFEPTIPQGQPELLRSQEMSLQRGYPPAQVPGYEIERFLGLGAYGEVWVALERNTGRRVAIKFYAHQGGLDWSLLSREVEKLAFLFADRYVVQLIGVGWDAEPPYYIMEYLERGSLAEWLQQGPLPVAQAVDIFHDVALGLAHAHSKGVLHCDLKPGNVLLDQDHKPRLADFGQSRLSHEQMPALGTLFYMAPEQADLEAVPDARWDVYAVGSLLYCMLTGNPPYRDAEAVGEIEQAGDLSQRLLAYRRLLRKSPLPAAHRKVRGVDRALAEIVDDCLAVAPQRRFANIQAVLDALRARAVRRARRPMMILGAMGPLLLLAVVAIFSWWGFRDAIRRSDEALTVRALEANRFAAEFVARATENELEDRWRAIERLADSSRLQRAIYEVRANAELQTLLVALNDPQKSEKELEPLRKKFIAHPARKRLQEEFAARVADRPQWPGAVWFLCDPSGVQLTRVPETGLRPTLGRNYGYRSYFTGKRHDMPVGFRPKAEEHMHETGLSQVYWGTGSDSWMAASSTPVVDDEANSTFLGVVAVSVEVSRFVSFSGGGEQFAVLVDMNPGDTQGVILQHPLFRKLLENEPQLPSRLQTTPPRIAKLPQNGGVDNLFYHDPVADDPLGAAFDKKWLAEAMPVTIRGKDTGWMVINQESYESAIGEPLAKLRSALFHHGMEALALMVLVMIATWAFAIRLLRESVAAPHPVGSDRATETLASDEPSPARSAQPAASQS